MNDVIAEVMRRQLAKGRLVTPEPALVALIAVLAVAVHKRFLPKDRHARANERC